MIVEVLKFKFKSDLWSSYLHSSLLRNSRDTNFTVAVLCSVVIVKITFAGYNSDVIVTVKILFRNILMYGQS